jgi:hypothetical protein
MPVRFTDDSLRAHKDPRMTNEKGLAPGEAFAVYREEIFFLHSYIQNTKLAE